MDRCAKEHGLDAAAIHACGSGDEGEALLTAQKVQKKYTGPNAL